MKKFFAVFAMAFALVLLVGCAEEPVEEELVTDEAEETLETAPADATDVSGEEMMEDTAMEGEGEMMEGDDEMMEDEGEMMEDEGEMEGEGEGN